MGCDKEPFESTYGIHNANLEVIIGNNQTGSLGDFLPDSLVLKATANIKNRNFMARCEPISGNGYVAKGRFYSPRTEFKSDSSDHITIHWKLGGDLEVQAIKIKLYIDSTIINGIQIYNNAPFDSVTVYATGSVNNGWLRASGCENLHPVTAKIVSFDTKTLYLNNRGLFSSTDGGLNWQPVEGVPDNIYITDMQFNSNGWMYLLTQNSGICYSKDLKNWTFINNGIIDYKSPSLLRVEDSIMFVNYSSDGLYYTRDNGEFWHLLLVNTNNLERHPNGALYLYDIWDDLFVSNDNGVSWQKLVYENQQINSSISSFKIDSAGDLYIACGQTKLTKISTKTQAIESHSFYQDNIFSQYVDDITFSHGTVYFTVQGSPSPGIYSSKQWEKLELDFNKEVFNYYPKADGTFLIFSSQGLYYRNH